jgi:parvulin-like peptidyl-prolyl isomerase
VNDFLSKELLSREVVDKIKVSEEDMKQYYKANREQFKKPEEVKARHILIKVSKDASPDEKKTARKKADEILAKIKKGEDFASLAEKYSDDPGSAKKGGDLGYFPRGRMVKPFEDAAFSLNPGEVSDIVETKFGYHIIKLEEKRPAGYQPFEAVKNTIRKELIKKVQNEKLKEYVNRLMKERNVKLYPERINMK